MLDGAVLAFFKAKAGDRGYQTLINQALHQAMVGDNSQGHPRGTASIGNLRQSRHKGNAGFAVGWQRRAVSALVVRPNGANQGSPGQRPGNGMRKSR